MSIMGGDTLLALVKSGARDQCGSWGVYIENMGYLQNK